VFALLGGVVAFVVAAAGSTLMGLVAGLICLAVGMAAIAWRTRVDDSHDPGRRRFLTLAGLGGLAWLFVGDALGRAASALSRPDARPVQEAMATDMGAEYMELVRRAYHPGRSGDLQLLLAPYNSANYANESQKLIRYYPNTSHASVWMYLERVPLLVYAPGRVTAADNTDRVTLADITPTVAGYIGLDDWPADRAGRPLITPPSDAKRPKVVVTFVIDGGGWNVLLQWPDRWPHLKRLMQRGANYRNAITGSFPAVTACSHATIGTGTYPSEHGITGHNIRDGNKVRKAYGQAGDANPGDILIPTLADLWSDATGDRAWVGEIGYQVWHLGMIGYGGRSRPSDALPVGVYWDESLYKENGIGGWAPHNPELFRLPIGAPGLDAYRAHADAFDSPGWDAEYTPRGSQSPSSSPPVVLYQGDLIEATLRNEPIGQSDVSDLLFINYKAPDYTGHMYNMLSEWEGLILETVDAQLGRLVATLDERFPNDYVLVVTADHGQCPLPDAVGGVRLDPIQLGDHIEAEFGRGLFNVVQSVVPSEVYLHSDVLWDNGATLEDVAAYLRDYRYRQNIGPYVPVSAIEQDMLAEKEFSAVFATTYLETLRSADLSTFGETTFGDGDPFGIPDIPP
jgi:Type I phosphodiesterase / nucleotide pyrophosphatase